MDSVHALLKTDNTIMDSIIHNWAFLLLTGNHGMFEAPSIDPHNSVVIVYKYYIPLHVVVYIDQIIIIYSIIILCLYNYSSYCYL